MKGISGAFAGGYNNYQKIKTVDGPLKAITVLLNAPTDLDSLLYIQKTQLKHFKDRYGQLKILKSNHKLPVGPFSLPRHVLKKRAVPMSLSPLRDQLEIELRGITFHY